MPSVFSQLKQNEILHEGRWFYLNADARPVSPGHLLVVSKSEKNDFFSLSEEDQAELPAMLTVAQSIIERQYKPDGYNIGMNCGEWAGQTVMHFHCHVIPRYQGDMSKPRGGIRHCIAGEGDY